MSEQQQKRMVVAPTGWPSYARTAQRDGHVVHRDGDAGIITLNGVELRADFDGDRIVGLRGKVSRAFEGYA